MRKSNVTSIKRRRRSQPRLGHGQVREALPSCVQDTIRAQVENDAATYGVSRSWVVASIVAEYYRIPCATFREGVGRRRMRKAG